MNPWAPAIAAAVAVAAIALLRASPLAARIVDWPGERSLHQTATPRLGGIGLMLGALPLAFALGTPEVRIVAMAAAGLALVSLVDNARPLPVAVRLIEEEIKEEEIIKKKEEIAEQKEEEKVKEA